MEYLLFSQEYLDQYEVDGTLLNHSRISPNNRARLFGWLSQECSKQRFSRYSYVLTCSYLDLFFMKKNQINLKDYQLLALGALVLASKQIQIEGKIPVIDLRLFPLKHILKMQANIAFGLNFYLNPPNYIELLNNIAKIWDIKCEMGQIQSTIRYFNENKESYFRLKTLYQKMDCLNLFKRILDFDIPDVLITLFYCQTKLFNIEGSQQIRTTKVENLLWSEVQQNKDQFQLMFQAFLIKSQIKSTPNAILQKIIFMFTKQTYPISETIKVSGRTFTQLVSAQTHNYECLKFYQKFRQAIEKI